MNIIKRVISKIQRLSGKKEEIIPTIKHLEDAKDLSTKTNESFLYNKKIVPLPPKLLMGSVGSASIEIFLFTADAWSQLISCYIKDEVNLLDIGCGCGKLARNFIFNPLVKKYIGFDVIKELIEWNENFIIPLSRGNMEFYHYDLYSYEYNQKATLKATELKFPAEDNSIDIAFAASLFTHLLEPDARHYLKETHRVLKKGGKIILCTHNEPEEGKRYSGNEARIDVDNDYFIDMARESGLKLHEHIGQVCGQETFVFEK